MVFEIFVNNTTIKANRGETILSALKRNGIKIPTLCHLENFSPSGSCRICVVEVEGYKNLVPACSQPVEEWMKIKTHSPRVIEARKTILETLMSGHPDDCLYCNRNGSCELQLLSADLNIDERKLFGKTTKTGIDKSSPAIVRDHSKCILCGRCIKVCNESQTCYTLDFSKKGNQTRISTSFDKPLNTSNCTFCGQCLLVCPTGALYEKSSIEQLQQSMHDTELKKIAQISPTSIFTIATELGIKTSKDIDGIVAGILKKIGFSSVYDTSLATDLLVLNTAFNLHDRLQSEEQLPLITSCCPAWVKFAEQNYPEKLSLLNNYKSPMLSFPLIYKLTENNTGVHHTALMPCVAKKYESNKNSDPDCSINSVISTNEIIKLIRTQGLDINQISPDTFSPNSSFRSSASRMSGVSGGFTEAVLRTLYWIETGNDMANPIIQDCRNVKNRKDFQFSFGKKTINITIVSGLGNARKLMDELSGEKMKPDFIEIMACPGGCINGGGQPLIKSDDLLKQRLKLIYDNDNKESIRFAHKNPVIMDIFNKLKNDPENNELKISLQAVFSYKNVLL